MKGIYDTANAVLTRDEMRGWIHFAYGVMENGIEGIKQGDSILSLDQQIQSIEATLYKGIAQELEARKNN